tara:strand:+ start:256 stop:777 length:522 start_codon:yes stop_codon:yes gene_type:complete
MKYILNLILAIFSINAYTSTFYYDNADPFTDEITEISFGSFASQNRNEFFGIICNAPDFIPQFAVMQRNITGNKGDKIRTTFRFDKNQAFSQDLIHPGDEGSLNITYGVNNSSSKTFNITKDEFLSFISNFLNQLKSSKKLILKVDGKEKISTFDVSNSSANVKKLLNNCPGL